MSETESNIQDETLSPEIAAEQTVQPAPVQPESPAPKGSLWPPVAIMGILVLLGLALFFFL